MRCLMFAFLVICFAQGSWAQTGALSDLTVEEAEAAVAAASKQERLQALLSYIDALQRQGEKELPQVEVQRRVAGASLEAASIFADRAPGSRQSAQFGLGMAERADGIYRVLADARGRGDVHVIIGRLRSTLGHSDPEQARMALQASEAALEFYGPDAPWQESLKAILVIARVASAHVETLSFGELDRAIQKGTGAIQDPRSAAYLGMRGTLSALISQIYMKRPAENRRANLDLAIELGLAATDDFVAGGEQLRLALGLQRSELAIAMVDRAGLGRPEIYLDAAEQLRLAAEILNRETQPLAWPLLQARRADTCMRHSIAVGSLDFSCSEEAIREVVTFITPEQAPELWGRLHLMLARVSNLRWEGGDLQARSTARAALEQVIASSLRRSSPGIWARAQHMLADLILSSRGVTVADVTAAETALDAASQVFEKLGDTAGLARVQLIRNTAEQARVSAEATEIAQSLKLTIVTGEEFPLTFAWIRSQPTLEPDFDALHAYRRAVDRVADPHLWAERLLDLAEAYLVAVSRDRKTNRKRAAEAVYLALETIDQEKRPDLWAWAEGLRAVDFGLNPEILPYSDRIDMATNVLEGAIASVKPDHREVWAVLHINLANTHLQRMPEPGHKERAEAALTKAMGAIDPSSAPHIWAAAMRTRGELIQRDAWLLPTDGSKTQEARYAEADMVYEELMAAGSDVLPDHLRLRLLTNRLRMSNDLGNWEKSTALTTKALAVSDKLLTSAQSENGLRDIGERASKALSLGAFAAVRLEAPADAMLYLERTRALTTRAVLEGRRQGLPTARFAELRTLRALLAGTPSGIHPILDNERAKTRSKIFRATSALDVSPLPATPPEGTAFLTMVVTADGGALILQTASGYAFDLLPPRSYPILAYQFYTSLGQAEGSAWEFGEGEAAEEQADHLAVYVWQLLERVSLPDGTRIFWVPPADLAQVALDAGRNPRTGETLIERYQISVLPSFAMLPYLEAHTPVSPENMAIAGLFDTLGDLRYAQLERRLVKAFATDRPMSEVPKNLSSKEALARFDGHDIWQFAAHNAFDSSDYLRSGVTLGRNGAGEVQRLSLQDLLYLADVESPTLVLLSVCQSAIVDVKHFPEDVTGMPAAFLRLGARGVISARWLVSDRATALLIGRFYWALIKEERPAYAALRSAKMWLRTSSAREMINFIQLAQQSASMQDLEGFSRIIRYLKDEVPIESKPYEDPKYWAAFSYYGL